MISLFKGTSIVSTMAIAELFYQVQVDLRAQRPGRPAADGRDGLVHPAHHVLSIGQYYVERHYAKGAPRALPLTPWQKVQRKITNINAARQEATFGGVR